MREIPDALRKQIEAIPDEEWQPRRVASTADLGEVLRTPDDRFENLPGYPDFMKRNPLPA